MARIREMRLLRGLTQAELAKRLGYGQPHVSQTERRVSPRISTLLAYAAALDVQLADLIE